MRWTLQALTQILACALSRHFIEQDTLQMHQAIVFKYLKRSWLLVRHVPHRSIARVYLDPPRRAPSIFFTQPKHARCRLTLAKEGRQQKIGRCTLVNRGTSNHHTSTYEHKDQGNAQKNRLLTFHREDTRRRLVDN